MDVAYFPTEPGEYAVHVLCNQDDIPKSPYMADIKPAPAGFDPSKVRVRRTCSESAVVILTMSLSPTARAPSGNIWVSSDLRLVL